MSSLLAAVWLLCLLAVASQAEAAGSKSPEVAPQREIALLLEPHRALRAPRPGAPLRARVTARRPLTGERTALPVLARRADPRGATWLKVILPGRPNGASGWINAHDVRLATTGWHLVVDLRTRRVAAYRDGRLARSFEAVIGKPSTPTPTGGFFVEETLKLPTGEPGGPFALALSARSNVLRHFEGGPGQIAIHGRGRLGGTLGAAESHGCIRLATATISWLARRIGPGTPVTIYRH